MLKWLKRVWRWAMDGQPIAEQVEYMSETWMQDHVYRTGTVGDLRDL